MRGVAVLGQAGPGPWELATGLAERGIPVVVIGADAAGSIGASVPSVACAYHSSAAVTAALEAAAAIAGPLVAVVDATVPPGAAAVTPLAEMDEQRWAATGEEPLTVSLRCLQGAHRALGEGGRYVVVVPSLSMSGAPGLVPWVSVSEGRRALVKVAARVWGAKGVTVNCLAVPAALLAAGVGQPRLERPGLPPRSLPRPPAMATEVAGLVAALLGNDLASVTGATLAVDGGVWMTP